MYFLKKNNNDREVSNVFDEMSNFFNNSFKSTTMKTDIIEKENEYEINIDVPGVEKKDINLELENEYLTISVNKEETKDESKKNYIKKERSFSSESRSFYVGDVKIEDVKAKLDKGILQISVPKTKEQKQEKKYISIE